MNGVDDLKHFVSLKKEEAVEPRWNLVCTSFEAWLLKSATS